MSVDRFLESYWSGDRLRSSLWQTLTLSDWHPSLRHSPYSVDIPLEVSQEVRSATYSLLKYSFSGSQQAATALKLTNIPCYRDFFHAESSSNVILEFKRLIRDHPLFLDAYILLAEKLVSACPSPDLAASAYLRFSRLLSTHLNVCRPDVFYRLLSPGCLSSIRLTGLMPELSLESLYGDTSSPLAYIRQLWNKGDYELVHLVYARVFLSPRHFPMSDSHLRAYSILGDDRRLTRQFMTLFTSFRQHMPLGTLSSILFSLLGLSQEPVAEVRDVVDELQSRSRPQIFGSDTNYDKAASSKSLLSVHERPILAVISPDLRDHPVGRFWSSLLPALAARFNIISVSLQRSFGDEVTRKLASYSHEWCEVSPEENHKLPRIISRYRPDIALDLAGHTADNQHFWLNHRIAKLQATYLGFYGPTYCAECDWWIVDKYVDQYIRGSYVGAEPKWLLPCLSLCYVPALHSIPSLDALSPLLEGVGWRLGSFNHTRKLSEDCLTLFASVLASLPDSTLFLRSHSFKETAVRRWFLQKFIDAGVHPSQLFPLAYAQSANEAILDYTRIHLHLDSSPVCGTTTTFDSLVMGVPVLTCPTRLYAGAITAAILDSLGLHECVADSPETIPSQARYLLRIFSSPSSRLNLARKVRDSLPCDLSSIPNAFAAELGLMLKKKSV